MCIWETPMQSAIWLWVMLPKSAVVRDRVEVARADSGCRRDADRVARQEHRRRTVLVVHQGLRRRRILSRRSLDAGGDRHPSTRRSDRDRTRWRRLLDAGSRYPAEPSRTSPNRSVRGCRPGLGPVGPQ